VSAYVLADGRDVPENSPLARIEREVRAQHLSNMRQLAGTEPRRMYLSQVERSEGKASRDALAAEYLADWEKRKAHAQALKDNAGV